LLFRVRTTKQQQTLHARCQQQILDVTLSWPKMVLILGPAPPKQKRWWQTNAKADVLLSILTKAVGKLIAEFMAETATNPKANQRRTNLQLLHTTLMPAALASLTHLRFLIHKRVVKMGVSNKTHASLVMTAVKVTSPPILLAARRKDSSNFMNRWSGRNAHELGRGGQKGHHLVEQGIQKHAEGSSQYDGTDGGRHLMGFSADHGLGRQDGQTATNGHAQSNQGGGGFIQLEEFGSESNPECSKQP
jgi:hypothetical protein